MSLMDVNAPPTSAIVGTIAVGAAARGVAWRGDGGALAVGTGDGRVVWIDPRMLSSSSSGGSVLYTTAAHSDGGETLNPKP